MERILASWISFFLKQWLREGREKQLFVFRSSYLYREKRDSCSFSKNGSGIFRDRFEWSCQDTRSIQWCVNFVKIERDYVQEEFDFFVWSAKWLGSISEVDIELAIVLLKWLALPWCWVQTLNPVRVVTTATNNRFAIPKSESHRVFIYLCCSFFFALRKFFFSLFFSKSTFC